MAGGATGCGTTGHALDLGQVYARTASAGTAQAAVNLHVGAPRSGTYVTAQGVVSLVAPAFTLAVQEAGVTFSEMRRGDELYLDVPVAARAFNRGKAWAEFQVPGTAGKGSAAGPASAGPVGVLADVDPAPVLGLLRLGPTATTALGRRRLNGGWATEYRLEFAPGQLAPSRAGAAGPAGLASLLVQMAHPRPASVPVYIWLDGRGRLVELELSVTLGTEPPSPGPAQAALANQLPATLSANIYLGHFGVADNLAPPAPDRTNRLPISELEGGAL